MALTFLTLAYAVVGSSAAFAQTQILTLQDSATSTPEVGAAIRSDSTASNVNSGTSGIFLLGTTATPASLRDLFDFSLSSLPANATITSVTLTLTGVQGDGTSVNTSVTVDLDALTKPFTYNQATWTIAKTGTNWTTPGGDYGTVLSSTTADAATFGGGSTMTFASTSNLVSALQTAYNTGQDFQFLVKLDADTTGTRSLFDIASGNSSHYSESPILTVDYTVPEPKGLSTIGVGLAGLFLLLRRKAKSSANLG